MCINEIYLHDIQKNRERNTIAGSRIRSQNTGRERFISSGTYYFRLPQRIDALDTTNCSVWNKNSGTMNAISSEQKPSIENTKFLHPLSMDE